MKIRDALIERNMTIYRLAKISDLPCAAVNDICGGKAQLEKCRAETVYRTAHTLDVLGTFMYWSFRVFVKRDFLVVRKCKKVPVHPEPVVELKLA